MQTHDYIAVTYRKSFISKVQPKLKEGWRIIQVADTFVLMERPVNSKPCLHCGRR